jgi:putative transposase
MDRKLSFKFAIYTSANSIGIIDETIDNFIPVKSTSNSNKPVILWVSSKQLCERLNITNQTFHFHRTKNWQFREANCEDGSKYEILLTSLSPEQIAKYNQHLILHEHEEKVSFKANLSNKDKEIALAKNDLILKYLQHVKNSTGNILTAKKQFIDVYNRGLSFPKLFKILGKLNWKTIDTHWLPVWKESGKDPFSLAPKYPEKKSTVTEEEAELLTHYFLTPGKDRPVRQDARYARTQMIIQNFQNIKSLDTYVRWLEDFKKKNIDVYSLCREGDKALKDKYVKPIKVDKRKLQIGDVLVGDGHKLNFEIIDPHTGKYRRMNLILFYDMASDMPVGWDISLTEDTETITIALYRSILRLGKIPKVIKLDNGRAFRSNFLNGMEADLEQSGIVGLFERLGSQVSFAMPYNAKAKPIERYFRTFSELEMRVPTYCGTSIENKPPRMMRNEKLHRRIFDKVMEHITIDIWTAHQLIANYFDEYSERIKKSGRLKGKRPIDIFKAGMGSGVDKLMLLFLMMEEKEALCYNDGFHLFGETYYSKELYGLAGQYFSVRFDIMNKDFIYVLDYKNNIICKAINDQGVHAAARILGDETDVQRLNEARSLQEEQYNSTYAKATALLNREMLPAIKHKVEQAETLRIIEEKEKGNIPANIKPTNIFSKIRSALPVDKKHTSIFYKKAQEG